MASADRARRLLRAAPRAGGFVARSAVRPVRRSRVSPGIPTRVVTPALAAAVLVDEMVMGWLPPPEVPPWPDLAARMLREADAALVRFAAAGWLDDAARAHPAPPAPDAVESVPRRYRRTSYEQVSFPSGFVSERPDRTSEPMVAGLVRASSPRRPWLVDVHGYTAGGPSDLFLFRSRAHAQTLDVNVVLPVLPLHGPRQTRGGSGVGVFSYDLVGMVETFRQAVWDVRRCIAWARSEGAPTVAVHGMSLGGHVGALVAALDDVDCVIAGMPLVDLAWRMRRWMPADLRAAVADEPGADERIDELLRVVGPLALPCRTPLAGRHLYAGVGDRVTTAGQAYRLWEHWDSPDVSWFSGAHSGVVVSRTVRRFVDAALHDWLATAPA